MEVWEINVIQTYKETIILLIDGIKLKDIL